eukprot:494752-Amorphochlora_amoeboformis.AAC.1
MYAGRGSSVYAGRGLYAADGRGHMCMSDEGDMCTSDFGHICVSDEADSGDICMADSGDMCMADSDDICMADMAIVCRTRLRSDHQLESRYNTSLGKTYDATVIGIKDFGAWVNIRVIPSARGHFIHATRIGSPHRYLTSVAEEVHIGQTIKAKVVGIDEKNRLQLERVFDSA